MKQPSTQVVSGASPEEGLAQITEIMKNHKESHEAILSNYNEMDIRLPLSCLAYQFGKTRLNTWEFLSYQNDKPVRNNTAFPNDCTKKLYILTYDSIMTLSRMDSLKISEDITLYCPAQVKNQLVLDINEELEQLEEEESVGQMHYTDAGLRFTELTDELRRNRYKVLVKLKDFVANLVEEPPINLVSDDANMRSFVTEANLRCETGALALAQKIQGGILITDDQFLYCTANFLGICNAGVAFLIAQMSSKCKDLLKSIDELKDLNFQNYFPYGLYKSAFDMSCGNDTIHDSAILWDWLTKDQEEPSNQHKEIIIQLYKEVLQSGEDYLNPQNALGHLAIHFYENLHPGFIESLIKKALEDMRIEVK